MTRKTFAALPLMCLLVSPVWAQPALTLVPGGIEAGNWVWQVDIAPDFVLSPSGSPLALELGFRLHDAPLLSAMNINPGEWDTPNPGNVIFGWETLTDVDPSPTVTNLKPVGLQTNTTTDEIFVAYGSEDFTTPGARPFLKIIALGPGNGGPLSSTIEWLGAYNGGNGRIAQIAGATALNFDIYSGMATQVIPEPASAALLAFGALAAMFGVRAFPNSV